MITVKTFFGLHTTPFAKNLSAEQLFNYDQLDELFNILLATVEDNSMALITGRAGVGKTTAVRGFLDSLPINNYKIIYLGQDQRGHGLLARLASELGLRSLPGWGKRILQISQRLELQAASKNIVIVVDEAHLLDQATLEDLRLLTNQEMDRRSPVSILLLAQHWLRFVLQKQGYEALYQRLRLRFALEGLSEEQTFAYIKHHLALCGATRDIFDRKSLARIYAASEGILREINNIAFECMMRAASRNQKTVDDKIVQWVLNHRETT
jgi:type II secretory pathway predicted ATPase ExeA